jgi:hypothetical protein
VRRDRKTAAHHWYGDSSINQEVIRRQGLQSVDGRGAAAGGERYPRTGHIGESTQAEEILTPFREPRPADQIAGRKPEARAGVIDAINQTDRDHVPAALKAGGEREGMDHAVPVVSRPAGSTEAARNWRKGLEADEQEIAAIGTRRTLAQIPRFGRD